MTATRPAGLPGRTSRMPTRALLGLTAVVVLAQIAWPLTRSTLREHLTVAIVIGFAAVCVLHAALTRSPGRAAVVLAVTALPGFAAEVVGVHTGFPFGSYAYSDALGVRVFGVPLVVALAWTMLSWPAALVARRLARRPLHRVLLGAWATTAGDFFLDPQLVAIHGWTWRHPSPHLPGVGTVPLTNYVGWIAVTLVLSALLQATMGDGGDALGLALYVWFWLAWTLALAAFLGRPAAAAWGAVAMGTVAVPLLVRLAPAARRSPRDLHPVGARG
ncbi:carotenoid biosynthesis protein [uncultured Jatrophihabitans sp.]|uniref:carotenoid biosynthesis protein n=1 Tax=uncultured Jatrophihabitans sp. TaxID=1610747 RepID=UPI0035CAF687